MEERPWTKSEFFAWNDGRRIVDIHELSKQLQCKQCCSLLDLRRTERETRYGLASVLYIVCNCGVVNDVHTGRIQHDASQQTSPHPMFEINIKASINLLMYGAGASRVLTFLALLDIPVPPPDDTSLIVPITGDSGAQSLSSCLPPTSSASTNVLVTSQKDLQLRSDNLSFQKSLSSVVPDHATVPVLLPVAIGNNDGDGGGNDNAGIINRNAISIEGGDGENGDASRDKTVRANIVHEESDDDISGGVDDHIDENDEEYLPPSSLRTRTKSKQAKANPFPQKKTPRQKSKRSQPKKAAKLVIQKHAEHFQIKREEEVPEEDVKNSPNNDKQLNGIGEGNKKDFANPEEWSSTESEPASLEAAAKDSDASWKEAEELDGVCDEKPKRKRGRPKGSLDRKKRAQRGTRDMINEPVIKKAKRSEEGEQGGPECTICSKKFHSAAGRNLHMKRMHGKKLKERVELDNLIVFVCKFCLLPFAKEHRIVSHLEMKHWGPPVQIQEMFYKLPVTDFVREDESCVTAEPKSNSYICLHCGLQVLTRKTTGDHMCIGPEGKASCVVCCPAGKKLTQSDGVTLFHVGEQCSLCYVCGAQFRNTEPLEQHLLSAHGVANWKFLKHACRQCGAMFLTPSRLRQHTQAKHHKGPRPTAHVCDVCGRAYPSRATMQRHRQLKHVTGADFHCHYCPKRFAKKDNLVVHTKRHLGQTPFQCRVCGKDFSCSYNLKTHERIHTGEKPYQCHLCEAAFAQKNSLNVHMKKHQRQQ